MRPHINKYFSLKTVLSAILFFAAGILVPALHAETSVDSITPGFGYNTGAVSITDLHSAGFVAGSTVTLTRAGETAITATGVSVVSSTQIVCAFDLLGKATGYWNIVVTTGAFSQTLTNTFEIRLMQVASLTPGSGYNTGLVTITDLRGAGFVAGSTVALTRAGETAIAATGVSVVSSAQIACVFNLSGKATGYWNIVVTTGSLSQTLASAFEIRLMEITSVAPYAGYNTGPVSITDLHGAGFVAGSTVALTRVGETAIAATGVSLVNSNQITCAFNLLGKATGYWDIVVTTGSLSQTLNNGFNVRLMEVTSLTPYEGYNTGPVIITNLSGAGFVAGSTVALTRAGETAIAATGVSVNSNQITCAFDLLGKATGYWNIVVTTGAFSQTLSNCFNIRLMQITSVTPYTGYNTGPVSITDLHGAGFVAGSTVALTRAGETAIAATGVSVNSNQITCAFDLLGKATGYWNIVVTTGAFSQTLNNGFNVSLMQVASVTPYAGYNIGPVSITDLHGAGFVAGSTVALTRAGETAIAATSISVVNSNQITCAFDLLGKATGYWDIVVTTGAFSRTLASAFEVRLMEITSLTPYAGYNTGPVSITDLHGAGFVAGSTVALTRAGETDISATGVSLAGSTQIACAFNLLGKATGYWDIVVTTGAFSRTLASAFEIRLMRVTSVTPDAGYNTGPISITNLSGAGFVAGSTVALTRAGETDISATSVNVIASTQITCAFDLLGKATGYWNIVVTTGAFSQTLTNTFEVRLMQVTSVTPDTGYNTGPVSITDLHGAGFVAGSTVALTRAGETDISATSVNVIASTRIACAFNLLGKATGYWDIVVTTGAFSRTLNSGFNISLMQVVSVTPGYGYNTGPVSITNLSGAGFVAGSTVALARAGETAIAATSVNMIASTQIACAFNLLGKATGYWDIVVTTGAFSRTLAGVFEIKPMFITSVTPITGYNTGSVAITDLRGEGFSGGGITVKLARADESDISATSVSVIGSTQITCALNLVGKATGYWDVVVSTGGAGSLSATLPSGFFVNAVIINSITPNSGYNTDSVDITDLSGEGFANYVTLVKLVHSGHADITATNINVVSSNKLTCKFDLAGKATGYWDVVVASGAFSNSLAGGFNIQPMNIVSITPALGSNMGPQTFAISGNGFLGGSVVTLSKTDQTDILAGSVNVVNSTRISCGFDLTGKTTGYWNVTVTSGAFTYTLNDSLEIKPMTITSVTPDSGYNSGPVIMGLDGIGLVNGSTITLTRSGQTDILATEVNVQASTHAVCALDLTGKATGYWNVVITSGSAGYTLSDGFLLNYLGASSITPDHGYNSASVSVTALRGGGFAAGASVKLARTGQTDISATGVSVVSSSQIACSFELTGKATGYWDVVVSTGGAGSLSATITNGFFVNYLGASSITPDHGYNSASVSVTALRGGGFAAGASVKLARTGQTDISATGVSVISSSQIACSFELTGKATGYWDVVVSTGGAGSLSAVMAQAFEVLCPVAETAVVNRVTDVSVTLKLESGDVGIEIPAGAFTENVSLTISTVQVPAAGRGTTAVSGLGVEIVNDKGLQPVKSSVITMYYRHSDIVGLDETKLVMGRYDPENSRWIPLPSTAYPNQNKVMGVADHFSVFSLIQLKPASSLSLIKVFPNPFNPGRHTQGLTIDNLTSDAKIEIFTVSGELVKKVEYTTRNGRAVWDGTNGDGRKVASGVYIALIKASGGNKKVKIAVEK